MFSVDCRNQFYLVKLAPFFLSQWEPKPKPIVTCPYCSCRAWRRLHVLVATSVVIGWSNYLAFGWTTINSPLWKRVMAWVESSCPSDCGKVWGDVGYYLRIFASPQTIPQSLGQLLSTQAITHFQSGLLKTDLRSFCFSWTWNWCYVDIETLLPHFVTIGY